MVFNWVWYESSTRFYYALFYFHCCDYDEWLSFFFFAVNLFERQRFERGSSSILDQPGDQIFGTEIVLFDDSHLKILVFKVWRCNANDVVGAIQWVECNHICKTIFIASRPHSSRVITLCFALDKCSILGSYEIWYLEFCECGVLVLKN